MIDDRRCPYLPGMAAEYEEFLTDWLDPREYLEFLSLGFRRSGRLVYRPICSTCSECRQIRIKVDSFTPDKSMRRELRRNQDVTLSIGRPEPTGEKYEIYRRYLEYQHDGTMSSRPESYVSFLYDSPTETIELVYREGQKIIGISIADLVPDGISSVYMYFDPMYARRSPGTYSILREIELCREWKLPYYYLGYYVSGCRKMKYKARFKPYEILSYEGIWTDLASSNI
jgi:arginine-tRNA-protein transferase